MNIKKRFAVLSKKKEAVKKEEKRKAKEETRIKAERIVLYAFLIGAGIKLCYKFPGG